MAVLRILLFALLILPAAAEARGRKHAARDNAFSPRRLVVDSTLPSDVIVGCLGQRNTRAPVLAMEGKRRVLLGPGEGWIDVSSRPGGSQLETRTEWVGGPTMERWARACAVGQKPRKPGLLARL